jgi:hypothetical protein
MVSAAETRSIKPTPRAIGGATCNATSIANDAITSNRVAAVALMSNFDLAQAAAMHTTPRLNIGRASSRFPPIKLRRERKQKPHRGGRKKKHERHDTKIDAMAEHGSLAGKRGRRFHAAIFQ